MNRYQVTTKSQKTGKEGIQTYLAKNEADLQEQVQKQLDFLATKSVIKTVVKVEDFGKVVAGYDKFDVISKGNAELAESMRREEWHQ